MQSESSLKYFLFKWSLQLERAEKYINHFLLVTIAFMFTICGLLAGGIRFSKEDDTVIPAYLTQMVWFIVYFYGFLTEIDFTDFKLLSIVMAPLFSLLLYLGAGTTFCYYNFGETFATFVHLGGMLMVAFLIVLVTCIILSQLCEHSLNMYILSLQYVAVLELYFFIRFSLVVYELIWQKNWLGEAH